MNNVEIGVQGVVKVILARTIRSLRVLLIALCGWTGIAHAEPLATSWDQTRNAQLRLIADSSGAGQWRIGLDFRLAPGWKTYWRSPGDAGLPAMVDWSGSTGIVPGPLQWPVPSRYTLQGFETFGFEESLVLLSQAVATGSSHIQADVDFLVCREVCLQEHARLQLDLPVPGNAGHPWKTLLDQWAARIPQGEAQDFSVKTLNVTSDGHLEVRIGAMPELVMPDLLVEGTDGAISAPPEVSKDGATDQILRVPLPRDPSGAVENVAGKRLTLTIIDRASPPEHPRAISVLRLASAAAPIEAVLPHPAPVPTSLPTMLGLALLGGLILNLMPCVLPVLSIKVLAVVSGGGLSRRHWRRGLLLTAAGIIAAFLTLAAMLAGLRASGLALGWGVQFQQPVFLAAMIAVTVAFAANLFGFFEISVAGSALVGRVATNVAEDQQLHGGAASPLGAFLTGVLATLLATPCSAPFLGTAVGFALTGSVTGIFAIFLCLGLGLAAPYFALAAAPWIGRFLPKPGRWMLTLRRFLGLGMIATSLWLVSVLWREAGWMLPLGILLLAAGALAGFALRHRVHPALPAAIMLLILIPALALIAPGRALPSAAAAGWQVFSEDRIAHEVALDHVVFVDVTAAWCLTCQVNERLILDQGLVHARLFAPMTVALRADWTRPDPAISAFMGKFGRFGIPFYVVFGPATPDGIALPEVITPAMVTTALDRARAAT